MVKDNIMRNIYKTKSIYEEFQHIGISQDLTIDQRTEHKALVNEAKTKEAASDESFLFRVVGPVGSGKVIKFVPEKKLINCQSKNLNEVDLKRLNDKVELKVSVGLQNIRSIVSKFDMVHG
ncbi:hypothetical protein HELRODRAFT_164990 [Helobdella robusta]|uniref:Uncharacterized protein n=1 Tax=Helobdella robusta TaxID=6412 RepID=T1EW30_HELRO|nr:hypothetical protein HELRODRAFT_164990 [Helobdella robusta]ESN92859.1 hypothetical protein HELRODRAFT_164990 [Helobdella robusta]